MRTTCKSKFRRHYDEPPTDLPDPPDIYRKTCEDRKEERSAKAPIKENSQTDSILVVPTVSKDPAADEILGDPPDPYDRKPEICLCLEMCLDLRNHAVNSSIAAVGRNFGGSIPEVPSENTVATMVRMLADRIGGTADLHGFSSRADRTVMFLGDRGIHGMTNIPGLGGMVDGIVVVLDNRSIRGVATAIRDFADHSCGSIARCQYARAARLVFLPFWEQLSLPASCRVESLKLLNL
ncbi:hypothetical protein E4U56_008381 [Claviceps arundinis]|uniref:Uncharacterized protein n=1 Tax=Claviceps arundinis TaxID=1623583 RepID=A0A9P7MUN2_9HYPO|nr:hypothetical protein E4U56_008381 [Claviceps arundinis]